MDEKKTLKDFRGREIKAGSVVVYPVRRGSSMWLVEAMIRSINEFDDKVVLSAKRRDGRHVVLRSLKRVVVVE